MMRSESGKNKPESVKVYDLPTRVFHWFFVFLFLFSFVVAEFTDDNLKFYSYHMLSGILLLFTILLRVLWGYFGSKYSLFSSYDFDISNLISYLKKMFTRDNNTHQAHNPASSYVSIGMYLSVLGLFVSGLFLRDSRFSDTAEELHEFFGLALVGLSMVHIIGIAIHSFKYGDRLYLSMLNGIRPKLGVSRGIASDRKAVAVLFIVLVVLFVSYLLSNYDDSSQLLNLFGYELDLTGDDHAHSYSDFLD